MSVALTMVASLSFAKTEGNYVGLNLLYSELETNPDLPGAESEYNLGYGIDYKYAINFDNQFYVAPGAFFNMVDSEIKAESVLGRFDLEVSNQVGFGVDLGYDFNDNIAAFVTLGIGQVRAELVEEDKITNLTSITKDTDEFRSAGIGVKYDLNNGYNVNFGYEMIGFADGDLEISTFKLGASYSF